MKLLCVLPLDDTQKDTLNSALSGVDIVYADPGGDVSDVISDVEVVVGNIKAASLKAAKSLKLLQLNTVGTGVYEAPGNLPEGAILCNAAGAYGVVVSEFIVAGMLALNKNLHRYRDKQRLGEWKGIGEMAMVSGSTVLIVGLGDIGCEVARRVKAMGAYVIGVRIPLTEKPDYVDEQYLPDALESLLPLADTVVLSLPGRPENRHTLNRARLAMMKPSAIIVNTARGNVVDQDALLEALKENRLAGALIDVTEPEPLPSDHPLWQQENVILTPHVAGAYSDWFYRIPLVTENVMLLAIANVKALLGGQPMKNIMLKL